MKLRLFTAVFLLTLYLASASILYGQGQAGTLNGTVVDQAGAVVPGAAVIVKNNATGEEARTTTTSAGAYTLPDLQAGTYTIRVTSPGFRTAAAENVLLRVAQTLTVDIKLEVGGITEQVVVSDKPELLEAGTAEIGRYITNEEYKTWPVFVGDGQRQIQEFIFDSLPGTTGNTFQGSINGGQQYSHEILIDGITLGRSDLLGGNNNELSPSSEAIGDFKLQTGAIPAQYNGGQTAVANFIIKSGTNDLHGSAFYYVQNEDFNGLGIQAKSEGQANPRNRLNNYGYSVGGPVYIPKIYHGRNRTFFFTDLERTKTDSFEYSGFTTLPTQAFKQGNFSQLLNPAFTGNALSGTQVGTDALGRPIVFGEIYDPRTTRTLANGAVVRDPFPQNSVPQSAWAPVAKNLLSQYSPPDPALDTMLRNTPTLATCCPYFHEWIFGIKIDHEINQKNHFSAYYNGSDRRRNNNSAGTNGAYLPVPGAPSSPWTEQYTPGNLVRMSLITSITPTLVNRVAAGYNRFVNQNGSPAGFTNQGYASKLGLQGLPGTLFPRINFYKSSPGDISAEWQGGTLSPMGVGGADYSANGSYVYQEDLTWIHGKHSSKFGYEFRNYFYNDRQLSDAGTFNFSAQQTALPASGGVLTNGATSITAATGNAFASFLLGAAQSASHNIVGISSGFRQPQHAFYFQDDWKFTPKLTFNLGFRWEIIPPLYEVTGRMTEVSLSVPNPGAGNRPGALISTNQVNDTYWKEFGPRVGVAYHMFDKVVVRAGYAMLNTPPITNGWGYGGFLYGYNGTVNVPARGDLYDPALYLSNPFPALSTPLPNLDPTSANFTSASTTARDADRPGYVQNWDLSIQYQLPAQSVLEVAYVGNKGTRLWGGTAYNQLDVLPSRMLSMGSVLNQPVSAYPQYTPFAGFPATNSVAQALLPYPQFYGVSEVFPYNTNSNYNSLQVTYTRHLTNHLGFLAAYTWSKTIGYVDSNGPSGYGTNPQDYFNRGLDRSVASFNTPHFFKLTWVYEAPFGKGRRFDLHWANPILGGWQLSAIHSYSTGYPIAVFESGLNTPAGFASGIRPDVVSGQNVSLGGIPSYVDAQVSSPYLNPDAFAHSPVASDGTPLRVGTAPRYLANVRGPAQYSETVQFTKKFYFGEEHRFFQVGGTLSNPFKRVTPYVVDTTVGDAAFGNVQMGGGDRTLQLYGRIEF